MPTPITGTVRISGPVSPFNVEDTYPATDPQYGLGGFRTVGTTAEMEAISVPRRQLGMMVYVTGATAFYSLVGTTANSGWTTAFQMGSGTNILPLNNTFTGTNTFTALQSFTQGISAAGGATFASTIAVTGLGTFSGGLSAAGTVTVNGAATFNSTLSGTTASFSRLVTATQGITSSSLNTTNIQAYGGSTFDSNLYVGATLTVAGNFIVNGTTTTINSTTITVDDKLIELAHSPSGSPGNNAAADGGGIQLNSSEGNKTFTWVNSTAAWTSSEDLNLVTGKVYEINGTSVLSSSTLGSGVTTSSLQAVGTISSGVWQGTVVGATYGGTGRSTYTIGDVLYANGTSSLTVLGASTAGRLLSSTGAGAAPEYKQLIIRDADAATVATESSGTGTLVMTIQNASTTVKGLARFDPLNFTVSGLSASVTAIDGGSY